MRTTSRSPRIVLAALLLSVAVVSLPAQRLYGPDDPPVRDLARLYRVAGEPFPTASFPVSTAWLHDAALALREEVTGAGVHGERAAASLRTDGVAAAIDAYIGGLGYAPNEVRTGVEIEFRPEAYLETDYLRGGVVEKLRREDPALRLRVSGSLHDGPLLHTRVEAIRDYNTDYPSNLTPPSESDPIPYEFNNVYEGYFHWPFAFVAITFGRQPMDLGPAPRSSIALAGGLPYHDALRITMDLGPIRMHHHISSIDNFRAREDVVLAPEGQAPAREVYDFGRSQIFFNTHYFEYRFDSWRLGVGAHHIVSRELNNFHLSDFFPVFSWHNANILPRNMSAFLDATVPVAPGFELYGQASYDDIRTTGVGIADTSIPTIPAYTFGGRYSRLGDAVDWDVALDLGYTHYLWGGYPLKYGLSRAVYRLRTEGGGFALPLTSPYGPGTVFAVVDAEASGTRFSAGLLYEVAGRKPDANPFTTAQAESQLLASQAYRYSHRVEAKGTYSFASRASASVQAGLLVEDGEPEVYLDLGAVIGYEGSATVATVKR
ncbi:MAG: hypothetical protein ACOCVW_03630 [bacterium]